MLLAAINLFTAQLELKKLNVSKLLIH